MQEPPHSSPGHHPLSADQAPASAFRDADPTHPAALGPPTVGAMIFDVDGVIASTAALHTAAWRRLAQEEELPFDDATADALRGLSREDSLRRLLGPVELSPTEFAAYADQKNRYYLESLDRLTHADVLPGVRPLLAGLADRGIRLAAVSLSRNARTVLKRTRIVDAFDLVLDGNDLARHRGDHGDGSLLSRDRFLLAARILRVEPGRCVVIEDAAAGIAAARAAGMRCVGVGSPRRLCAATLVFESFHGVAVGTLIRWLAGCDAARAGDLDVNPASAGCQSRRGRV